MPKRLRSFRMEEDLEKPVSDWLKQNRHFSMSSLINEAIRYYIAFVHETASVPVELPEEHEHLLKEPLQETMPREEKTLEMLQKEYEQTLAAEEKMQKTQKSIEPEAHSEPEERLQVRKKKKIGPYSKHYYQ